MLRHMLQVVQHQFSTLHMAGIFDPDLGQALVRRQLAGCTAQVLALDAGADTLGLECIGPQRGDETVRSLGNALHAHSITPSGAVLWVCCGAYNRLNSFMTVAR